MFCFMFLFLSDFVFVLSGSMNFSQQEREGDVMYKRENTICRINIIKFTIYLKLREQLQNAKGKYEHLHLHGFSR